MKKYLFIALAAAALTSCSSDETLDNVQGEAIQFGNAFVGNSTRATEATDPSYGPNKNIESFTVYGTVEGVNIFNAATVTKDNAAYGAAWSCPVTQYWVDGANYEFAAVVGATKTNVNETTKMPTSLEYTASGQTDMLYQKVTTTGKPTSNNGLVAFTFNHLLAKAKFTFTNTTSHEGVQEGTAYTYDITDLKITNTYASATYDVINGWNVTNAETAATDFGSITALANGTPQECAEEKLLIPGLTSVTVSFNYSIKVNGTTEIYKTTTPVTATANINGGILANNAYNFNVSLGLNNKIEFTVTKAPDWVTPTNNVEAQ